MNHSGRLELTWTNKDKTLLAHEDGTYEWVDPADHRVAEVRLLTDVTTVGETLPATKRAADNLLIRGDALHALQSLNRIPEFADEYLGKVRLVYIDPPFNTGQAFTQYDDNLEHSVWLTMLRDRLMQIKPLLAPNGSVWVHLDEAEVHRCRVVMDEVFGPENHAGTVIWEKTTSARNDVKLFSTDQDYILIYARDSEVFVPAKDAHTEAANSAYRNPDDDPRGPWREVDYKGPKTADERPNLYYPLVHPVSGGEVWPRKERVWAYGRDQHERHLREDLLWWGKTGNYTFPKLKKFLTDRNIEGTPPRTLWRADVVDTTRRAKDEIKRLFPGAVPFATPKPEKLLQRIVHLATDPGDVVLDCFAGSGTTAAVAHKMGRRWVTCEREPETVSSFTLPRLTKVVNNEDPGGITSVEVPTGEGLPEGVAAGEGKAAAKTLSAFLKSEALDDLDEKTVKAIVKAMREGDKTTTETLWSGGGGFRVLDVGPSMFEEVDGRIYLAEWAVNGKLAEAIAAQYGYAYEPDGPFCGTKGQMRLAVIDGLVNEAVVRLLADALPEGQRVAVCATAVDPDARAVLRELRPGSTLKKVPASLLDEYRVSRRDRLRMANLLDRAEAAEATTEEELV